MKYLKKIHLSACGLSLALASLGNLLGARAVFLKAVCFAASLFVLMLVTLKILLYRKDFMADIRNLNIVAVFPTYFMTFMTLSTYISLPVGSLDLTVVIWLLGSVFHVSFALLFFKNHVLKFDINMVAPNWFITFVAYALGGIAAPMYGMRMFGQILVIAGLSSYFILFPVVLYRVWVINQIPDSSKPAIWLFNSPINICIVAYLSSFSSVSPVFLLVLLSFSLFSFCMSLYNIGTWRQNPVRFGQDISASSMSDFYGLVGIGIKQIIKSGFTASVLAFTFPTVIFVTAIRDSYYFLRGEGYLIADLTGLIMLLEIAAAFVVIGIFAGYTIHVFKSTEQGETPRDIRALPKL